MLTANTFILLLAILIATLPLFAFSIPSFTFTPKTGLSNRMLTPNGDNRNDNVVFTFTNPRDSVVSGRVYDLKGGLVARMQKHPALDPRFHLYWDGKANGRQAAPGVYIYQLEAENRIFTGTVVVVR
ncbi:MAG: gliding motility-associated C-terminal domain-containing protein [Elusimicrobiota bacterium]